MYRIEYRSWLALERHGKKAPWNDSGKSFFDYYLAVHEAKALAGTINGETRIVSQKDN